MQTTNAQRSVSAGSRLPYTRRHRLGETMALMAVAMLTLAQLIKLAAGASALPIAHVVLALTLAPLAADALSGLVHWLADTWGNERTPALGPWIIRSFRDHHDDPAGIARHDFVETNGATAAGLLPLQAVSLTFSHGSMLLFAIAFSLLLLFTNQIHAWAHAAAPPSFVVWLQARGLLLSPAHHASHHAPPFVGRYCITTGWCNALFDSTETWRWLERCITRVAGARPRAD